MIIDFLSLKHKEVNKDFDDFTLKAILKKQSSLIDFKGEIKGKIDVPCDICSEYSKVDLYLNLDYKISNTHNNCEDGSYYDYSDNIMYEFIDNKIDIDFIVKSEINAFKSDYFTCSKCDNQDNIIPN